MTMANMVLLSAYLFGVPLTFHKVTGVASIILTTYMYMNIAIKLPKPPQQANLWKSLCNSYMGLTRLSGEDESSSSGATSTGGCISRITAPQ